MKPKITWILIADGARARVLCHDGPGRGVAAVPDALFEASHAPDREIDADKPGRTFDSVGAGRHHKEPRTSPHRQQKADFARELAQMLERRRGEGAFDRLLVVAPPATIGDLRSSMSKEVRGRVIAEVAKDLTHVPNAEIDRHLEDVLAV